jgi:hypothetical protein
LQGEAEITYSMPPFHHNVEKSYAKAGDAYLIYRGERVTFKIISNVPYRYISYVQPAPPIPSGEQLIDSLYEEFNNRLFEGFKKRRNE